MNAVKIAKLTARDLQHCAAQLTQHRTALQAALLGHNSAERQPNTPNAVEVHDSKDDAFAALTAAVSGTTLTHLLAESAAVQAALHRVSEGSYGRCIECNRDIGRERLLAQPSAGRCLPCQERSEPVQPGRVAKGATRLPR
jgi:DnaK suppressor protein